ncbi:MAG TPA: transketolase [Candidatus Paceibacterota bacterium]|nr:transketolase [Candidatus Paceibacterota bacterium]
MNPNDIGQAQASLAELELLTRQIRFKLVEMSHAAGTPHLGSALSCVDILVAAYWWVLRVDPQQPNDPLRDRCILSKGHAATTLYATLAYRGFFPASLLDTYAQHRSPLAEHPGPNCAPGVELATGSLGHGLPVGLGMALAGKIQHQDYRVFVVMSDGECNEGSVWEAAMFAPNQGLDRLAIIVDYNKWQATGRSNEIMALASLARKWEAFGWSASEVDGHDLSALIQALSGVPDGSGKPVAIIAHTTKGKGVSFMEDDNNWHYRVPKAAEVEAARQELCPPDRGLLGRRST